MMSLKPKSSFSRDNPPAEEAWQSQRPAGDSRFMLSPSASFSSTLTPSPSPSNISIPSDSSASEQMHHVEVSRRDASFTEAGPDRRNNVARREPGTSEIAYLDRRGDATPREDREREMAKLEKTMKELNKMKLSLSSPSRPSPSASPAKQTSSRSAPRPPADDVNRRMNMALPPLPPMREEEHARIRRDAPSPLPPRQRERVPSSTPTRGPPPPAPSSGMSKSSSMPYEMDRRMSESPTLEEYGFPLPPNGLPQSQARRHASYMRSAPPVSDRNRI